MNISKKSFKNSGEKLRSSIDCIIIEATFDHMSAKVYNLVFDKTDFGIVDLSRDQIAETFILKITKVF